MYVLHSKAIYIYICIICTKCVIYIYIQCIWSILIYIYTVHIHIAVEPPGTQAAHQLARKPRKMNKDTPEIPHRKKVDFKLGKITPKSSKSRIISQLYSQLNHV